MILDGTPLTDQTGRFQIEAAREAIGWSGQFVLRAAGACRFSLDARGMMHESARDADHPADDNDETPGE